MNTNYDDKLKNIFSVQWNFGCRGLHCEEIEIYEQNEIENILDSIYKENDDIIQFAVLYCYNQSKACHTMEIPEISHFRKDFLNPIKNNKTARYFDNYCSCDFELVSAVIDDNNIHLTITDKNDIDNQLLMFDHIIEKKVFLQEMDRTFNEVYTEVDKLIIDYSIKHRLTSSQQKELRTRLYEW